MKIRLTVAYPGQPIGLRRCEWLEAIGQLLAPGVLTLPPLILLSTQPVELMMVGTVLVQQLNQCMAITGRTGLRRWKNIDDHDGSLGRLKWAVKCCSCAADSSGGSALQEAGVVFKDVRTGLRCARKLLQAPRELGKLCYAVAHVARALQQGCEGERKHLAGHAAQALPVT
ncbi:hypothetical protein [Xanthomonas citri]|uniref:hypothetical protein n=1 Tax=Xanthomonas citri TaxID=346 RepID=UPI00103B72CF|nr:hypothetical protein [Xanthomonas citri]